MALFWTAQNPSQTLGRWDRRHSKGAIPQVIKKTPSQKKSGKREEVSSHSENISQLLSFLSTLCLNVFILGQRLSIVSSIWCSCFYPFFLHQKCMIFFFCLKKINQDSLWGREHGQRKDINSCCHHLFFLFSKCNKKKVVKLLVTAQRNDKTLMWSWKISFSVIDNQDHDFFSEVKWSFPDD